MENDNWKMANPTLSVQPLSRYHSKVAGCLLPQGPRFRRRVAENAYPVMRGETGILFSFCFGSHGQRILLAVGFSSHPPTTTADSAVIVATNTGISRAAPLTSWFP